MSAAEQHPFVAWVVTRHGEDNDNLGDFATNFAPSLPVTGTHDELRDLLYWTAPHWALQVFDGLWANYQHALWVEAHSHPFAAWMLEKHGKAATPLGDFARDVAPDLPATGDRAELREWLADSLGDSKAASWTLTCFDVGWQEYRPTCEAPDCRLPVGYQMSLCGTHAPLRDLL